MSGCLDHLVCECVLVEIVVEAIGRRWSSDAKPALIYKMVRQSRQLRISIASCLILPVRRVPDLSILSGSATRLDYAGIAAKRLDYAQQVIIHCEMNTLYFVYLPLKSLFGHLHRYQHISICL